MIRKESRMADCELIAACPFFNDKMADMPSMAALLKKQYCNGQPSNCARYQVRQKLGKEKVPADLFPNQNDRVRQLMK